MPEEHAMHRSLSNSFKRLQDRFRLDHVLTPDVDPRTGKRQLGFETEEAAGKEDCKRAILMEMNIARGTDWTSNVFRRVTFHLRQRFTHLKPPTIPPADINDLRGSLLAGTSSLASSVAMRNLRLSWIGAVLELFDIYADADICTFTVLNSNCVFTAEQLQTVSAASLKNQFRTHLNRIGIDKVPGPLIAFLHGEFESTSGKFVLHFHGVTTKEKYDVLLTMSGSWGYEKTLTGAHPIRSETINNRPRQFSYQLKSFWPQRQVRLVDGKPKRDRRGKRIHEPYASIALIWLDRQSPADIAVLQGCRFMPNGRLRATETAV